MSPAERKRWLNRLAQRRRRTRGRHNLYRFEGDIQGAFIEEAITAGLLTDEASHDPKKIGSLLKLGFLTWLDAWLK